MVNRFRQSPQLQLLCIALSLVCASTVFGLSAFLTDTTDPLSTHLTVRRGNEFGISIASFNYQENADIYPGARVPFDPYLNNEGDYDVYVFMQVDLADPDFSLELNQSDWTLLPLDNETMPVYAYGSRTSLTRLEAKNPEGPSDTVPLCSSIRLDSKSDLLPQPMDVSAIGYAIQVDGLNNNDPLQVWEQLNGQMASDAQDQAADSSEEA